MPLSIGSFFHCTKPGWFRIYFANMDNLTMKTTLRRIWTFVDQKKGGEVVPVKNKRWQKNLRLSFSSRIYDDSVMSPHMSPHSPMPHSPLVRAQNWSINNKKIYNLTTNDFLEIQWVFFALKKSKKKDKKSLKSIKTTNLTKTMLMLFAILSYN